MSNRPYPKKKNYRAGDWFAVPLRTKGFALCVVAREKRGQCLGYFFRYCGISSPVIADCINLEAKDAILICMFSDYAIRLGDWSRLGHIEGWRKEDWPMPIFASTLLEGYLAAIYPDDNPAASARYEPISKEKWEKLPRDTFSGSGAVEIVLTRILDPIGFENFRNSIT